MRFAAAVAVLAILGRAEEPPLDLVKRVAQRETESEAHRANFTYRQNVTLEEMSPNGGRAGLYRETRDVIFSPEKERSEVMVGRPTQTLHRLRLTDEDFRDMREIQPLMLTTERLPLYRARFRGEEPVDGQACWVIDVAPKQLLEGQRLFEGLLWIDKSDYSIVRSEGKAVPQIFSTRNENLFPRFTTVRERIDGYWFPVVTHADDVLPFRTGPLRLRMRIDYVNYKRFGSDSTIRFEGTK